MRPRAVGPIALPREFRPFVIGTDHVLGRWADDLGVESVRMCTLERS